MIYDFDKLTFQILTIKKLCHDDGFYKIKGRPFAALAYRLRGKAEFEIDEKSFVSNAGDLFFIPKNVSYTAKYSHCEYIVIHFEKCNYKMYENITTGEEKFLVPLFTKLLKDWEESHSVNKAKSQIYDIFEQITKHKALSVSDSAFTKALKFIETNFCNPDLDMPSICDAINISEASLRRKFNNALSISPKEYLIKLRLNKAIDLLIAGELSIKKVSESCGFSDEKYFSRVIKERYNQPPSAFSKKSAE